MRDLGFTLERNIDREDLTLCLLVELQMPTGEKAYYTNLSSDVKYGGVTYASNPGVDVSSIRQSMAGSAQSCNVIIAYDDTIITEDLVRYGFVDNATVIISLWDYSNFTPAPAVLFSGLVSLAELNEKDTCDLTVESSSVDSSTATIGEPYSQRCRNIFGDRRCKVDLEPLKIPFTVLRAAENSVSFAINNEGDLPPEELPPEEAPVFDYVSGEVIYQTFPNEYDFVVPKCQTLVVEVRSGSGGSGSSVQNALDTRVQSYLDGFDGTDAEPTSFGGYVIPGGKRGIGGKANYQPNNFALSISELTIRNKERLKKPATQTLDDKALDYLLFPSSNPGFAEIAVNRGADGVPGLSYVGIPGSQGGDGAPGHFGTVRIDMTAPGAPEAGSVIKVRVGAGGKGGGFDGTPGGNWMEGVDGGAGAVKITWTSNNEVVEQNEEVKIKPYSIGTVDWTKGENRGTSSQIAFKEGGIVSLLFAPFRGIRIGDQGVIKPGCSNYADMCENVWNNLKNMQAEPAVPQGQSTAPIPVSSAPTDTTKPPAVPIDNFNTATALDANLPVEGGGTVGGGSGSGGLGA